jgi:hypothetical protein
MPHTSHHSNNPSLSYFLADHHLSPAFENSIVTKKIDSSDPVKFHKIRYNSAEFWLEEVLYSNKPKNKKSAEFTD